MNKPNESSRALIFSADRELEFLSDFSEAVSEAASEKEIYTILGHALHLVVGEQAIINISDYHFDSKLYRPQALVGLGPLMELVVQLLGRRPEELAGDYPAVAKAALKTGRMARLEGGVVALAGEALSPLLCSTAASVLGLHDVWVLGYARGTLAGGVSIISRAPGLKLRVTLIEALVRQATGALKHQRTEEALRCSEERFRTLVTMVGDIIWRTELDGEGRLVDNYISPVLDRLLGLPEGTIDHDSERLLSRVHRDDVHRLRALFQENRTPGREFSLGFRFLRQDGSVFPVQTHGVVHARPGGGLVLTGVTTKTG